jgi:hypothetical protein
MTLRHEAKPSCQQMTLQPFFYRGLSGAENANKEQNDSKPPQENPLYYSLPTAAYISEPHGLSYAKNMAYMNDTPECRMFFLPLSFNRRKSLYQLDSRDAFLGEPTHRLFTTLCCRCPLLAMPPHTNTLKAYNQRLAKCNPIPLLPLVVRASEAAAL